MANFDEISKAFFGGGNDLLGRAAELREQRLQHEASTASSLAETQRIRLGQQIESRERALQFVSLVRGKVDPFVLIEEKNKPRVGLTVRSEVERYIKLGRGWLARDLSYDYETAHVPGLWVAESGDVRSCWDVHQAPPTDADPRLVTAAGGEPYAMVFGAFDDQSTVFAGDAGRDILARALDRYDIV